MTLGRLARLLRVRANAIIGTCLDENIPAQLVADENSVIEPELETKIRAWFPPRPQHRPHSPQPSLPGGASFPARPQPSPANPELLTPPTDGIGVQGQGEDAHQPTNPAEALGSDNNPGTGPNTGTATQAEKRRRRRRRGGRGRGKGGDAPNPPTAAAPQINADRAPRPPNNQGGRDGGNRNDRPPSRDTNRPPRPSNSTPTPPSPATPPAPAKPPVRTLYGSVIRKLKPGQIGSIKREE